ncbi:MAG: ThiF family adenylyltransferase [Anaerolineaceae bacterium]|nr:ThiF family adenylyltransferase [Anaerolineaceae bacterium]MBN2677922.1 ThiF family adenylyltransferase [Anaerolineaceae bacterium]
MPVTIQPIEHYSLAQVVAGKLAALIQAGSYQPEQQLPSERDLIAQFEISRATLREALTTLSKSNLIEAKPGVGWFVCPIDENNLPGIRELASIGTSQTVVSPDTEDGVKLEGPRRLPVTPEKPLHIPNLHTDRLGTFDFISWWEREKVQAARVLIVGAGALGNEVIKNLSLMGVGHLFIIDFDDIEAANLSRSVLFREVDNTRSKAEIAAARARQLNPDVKVQYLNGDVTSDLGLGVIRRMDVVIGCLDNREARLAVNRFCYWMGKPWVDGAIQELLGLMRVFVPGQGACYECTLTEAALRDLSLRYSCPLLARQNILLGKVPTTPTIAAIIGGMQSQEALKLINGLPVEAGKVVHYNGLTNEMHTTAYLPREGCESHWTYGDITELPLRAERATLTDLYKVVRADLGEGAVLELDQELVISLECPLCHTITPVLRPLAQVSFEEGHCPECGTLRETSLTHEITGNEEFLHHTLSSLGIPPLQILRAHNASDYRFYELSGDLADALHFRHFERIDPQESLSLRKRIRIQAEQSQPETLIIRNKRIKLHN